MVTYFQFQKNGSEVLSGHEYFKNQNKKVEVKSELDEAINNYDLNNIEINKINNQLKTAIENPESLALSDIELSLIKSHEEIVKSFNEINDEVLRFYNLFCKSYHFKSEPEIEIYLSFRENDIQDTREIRIGLEHGSSWTRGEYFRIKRNYENFMEKNKDSLERIKNKENYLIELRTSLNSRLENKINLEELISSKKNELGSLIETSRIDSYEIDRLNNYLEEIFKNGWSLKSITPINTGLYSESGSNSRLFGGTGEIHGNFSYGLTFTDGILLHWEEV